MPSSLLAFIPPPGPSVRPAASAVRLCTLAAPLQAPGGIRSIGQSEKTCLDGVRMPGTPWVVRVSAACSSPRLHGNQRPVKRERAGASLL